MVPWIIAHRGDATHATENTIAAFESAIRLGADMIEMDVQRLKDGTLVVFHDDRIDSMALKDIGLAEFQTYATIQRITVPTLDQVLKACAGRVKLMIEMKNHCVTEVLRSVEHAHLGVNDYLLECSESDSLLSAKAQFPTVRTALLTEQLAPEEALPLLKRISANYWAPSYSILSEAMFEHSHKAGIGIIPWTVNDKVEMKRFLSAPAVAGIITDRTEEAIQLRRHPSASSRA